MMESNINISQWTNRTRGIMSSPDQQQRLKKITDDLINVAINDAISSLGITERECFCVKEITIPVTIGLSRTIRSQARRWGHVFAKQIAHKQKENSDSLVYYPSLSHAHIACAEGVLRCNLSSLWAWQQLGLLSVNEGANEQEVLNQWCKQSRGMQQIALWRYILRSPLLQLVLLRFTNKQWDMQLNGLSQAMQCDLRQLKTIIKNTLSRILLTQKTLQKQNIKFKQLKLNEEFTTSFAKSEINTFDYKEKICISLPDFLQNNYLLKSLQASDLKQHLGLFTVAFALAEPSLVNLPKILQQKRIEQLCQIIVLKNNSRNHSSNTIKEKWIDKKLKFKSNQRDVTFLNASVSKDTKETKNKMNADVYLDKIETEQTQYLENLENKIQQKKDFSNTLEENNAEQIENLEQNDLKNNQSITNKKLTPYGGLFWLINLLLQMPEFVNELTRNKVFNGLSQQWIWFWFARQLLPDTNYRIPAMLFAGLEDESPGLKLFLH